MSARDIGRWARLLAGAGLLGLLVWRLGSGPFVAAVHAVNGAVLAAALAIGAVTTVASAGRWVLVAGRLGVRLPLPAAVADYYRALFLNAVLPGGVLGDVHRAVRHGRDVGDVSAAVKAVVLERTAGQVVLVAAATAVLVSPSAVPLPTWFASAAAVLAATAGAAVLVGIVVAHHRPGWVGTARAGLSVRILGTSVVVLAGHLATFVVAARAAGSTASLTRLVPLMLLALLAMSLPINVGGWGPREGVTAWAFAAAGLDAAQGLTTAVVYGLLALVASLPGALVLANRRLLTRPGTATRRRTSAARRPRSVEPPPARRDQPDRAATGPLR